MTLEKFIPGFVIPLRIDDREYQLLPIEILRENAINFAHGWHHGMAALMEMWRTLKLHRGASRTRDP